MQEVGTVQVDPLDVVGQNQDLVLSSRVEDYMPRDLDQALYARRTLFEWGGNLQIRPIEELPYMVARMKAWDYLGRRALFERTHRALMNQVLRQVEREGPIGSRALAGGANVQSYRARRDTGVALYYLWIRGDLMIHSRVRGERMYHLTNRLVPSRLLEPAPADEGEEHLFHREMGMYGLANASELLAIQRMSSEKPITARQRSAWIETQVRNGQLTPLKVNGWGGHYWLDSQDLHLLEGLARGETPKAWRPLRNSTEEEATFFGPLEIVSARGRSKRLFDFDYLWEVYKPARKRRWGYYTLPILHGENLKARSDLKADRESKKLRVLGFWFEDGRSANDPGFSAAVRRGLERLARMTGSNSIDYHAIRPPGFRALLQNN
ncbi:MAG: crosslink repair DNA glycosylase YcaQ family protein [Thermoplasmata archaeon]